MKHEFGPVVQSAQKVVLARLFVFGCVVFLIAGVYFVTENITAALGLPLVLFIIGFLNRKNTPSYVVTENGVIVKKGEKVSAEYAYKDYAMSSLIVEIKNHGITVGRNRQLVLNDGKKEKKILIVLGKEKYDEFMSLISNYSAKWAQQNGGASIAPRDVSEGEDFPVSANLPNRSVFKLEKNNIVKTVFKARYIPLIIILLAAGVAVLFALNGMKLKEALVIPFVPVPFLVFYYMFVLPVAVLRKGQTPNEIVLTKNEIKIDGTIFNFASVSKIKITPTSDYNGRYKRIDLYGSNNEKTRYYLGFQTDKVDTVFPQYNEFASLLEQLLAAQVGKFQYDL